MRMTEESSASESKRSSPFVPLLNVSSVGKNSSSGYYDADDDDEPPLTEIREIVLSSRDRGAFEAGEWSEIRSEMSDNRSIVSSYFSN